MNKPSQYDLVQLGRRAEYLAGIDSVSVVSMSDISSDFPNLAANTPRNRYRVERVVEELSGLLEDLKQFKIELPAQAKERLPAMLAEMQLALQGAPRPNEVILRDHFADELILLARQVIEAIEQTMRERKLGR